MTFQWLEMRISEEQDRRAREALILDRLPKALEEAYSVLTECVKSYTDAFGTESADTSLQAGRVVVDVREKKEGRWKQSGQVEVIAVPELPGFRIERPGGDPLLVEVGVLPGDKLYYRDRELDQYLTMDELTKRILDRALFPKLKD